MRSSRAARKRSGDLPRSKLCVTRKPLIVKKTKTPRRPRMPWLPLSTTSGSFFWLPSAIRKACENSTETAAARRRKSKFSYLATRGQRGSARGCSSPAPRLALDCGGKQGRENDRFGKIGRAHV